MSNGVDITNQGRGAWSGMGVGGTLNSTGTGPGRYYSLAKDPNNTIGMKSWCQRANQIPVPLNYNAVFHGVVAIQMLLNSQGADLEPHGMYDKVTAEAVKRFQRANLLSQDGVVGRLTMEKLLLPTIERTAKSLNEPAQPIIGILANESAWDPGAVGFMDVNDLGLAQINTIAHPHVSFAQAFCPSYAVRFIAELIRLGLDTFDDLELAVASYNLGIGGTRQWIAAGQPDVWTPSWASAPRNTRAYINRILER